MLYSSSLAYANENWYRGEEDEQGLVYSSAVEYSSANDYLGGSGQPTGDGLIYSSAVEYSSAYDYLGLSLHAGATLTYSEVGMLCDIWQRFGLDPSAPLTESATSSVFGAITLAKFGTSDIVTTRSGNFGSGDASAMISDLWQRLGLDPDNPMTASETQISAGSVSQSRAVSGGTVTVTRTP